MFKIIIQFMLIDRIYECNVEMMEYYFKNYQAVGVLFKQLIVFKIL